MAATLTYLMARVYDDRIAIAVANQPAYGYPDYLVCSMEIHDSEGYFSATFLIVKSLSDYTLFRTDTIDYSYDANTITLTINSSDFMEYDGDTGEIDSSSVVTISGTLQGQTINFPANTPTQVGTFDDAIKEGTLTLEENGIWLITTVLNFMGETMTDTGMGTWKVEDDELIVIEKEEDYSDTLTFSYTISSNTLTLIREKSWCEGDEDYTVEECLEEAEGEFGLESGSLTDIISVFMANFSKTSPTARIRAKPNTGHLLQSKFLQHKWSKYHPFR